MKNFRKRTLKRLISMSLGLTLALSTFQSVIPVNTPTASAATTTKGNQVISTGAKYLGVKYKLGGLTPKAFDCQGFTKYVFKKYGVNLPIGARNQSKVGKKVSRQNLRPGDLVFFSTKATMKYKASSIKRIGHVGIYAGKGKILHTYGKGGVKFSNLKNTFWGAHYVTARRVIG